MEANRRLKRRAEEYEPRGVDLPPRGERAVDDKQVDEFFNILRRVREARRVLTWRPVFTLDDFREELNGRDCRGGERGAASRRFDLNAEPEDDEVVMDGRD